MSALIQFHRRKSLQLVIVGLCVVAMTPPTGAEKPSVDPLFAGPTMADVSMQNNFGYWNGDCWHRDGWYQFGATGATVQEIPGQTPFVGTASVTIAAATFAEASVTTILLGEPIALPSGALLAPTSHTFDFGPLGSMTTMDQALLLPTEPPCMFRLYSWLRIIPMQGTGYFGDAKGALFAYDGEINLCTGEASWSMRGTVRLDCPSITAPIATAQACAECPFVGTTTVTIGPLASL